MKPKTWGQEPLDRSVVVGLGSSHWGRELKSRHSWNWNRPDLASAEKARASCLQRFHNGKATVVASTSVVAECASHSHLLRHGINSGYDGLGVLDLSPLFV